MPGPVRLQRGPAFGDMTSLRDRRRVAGRGRPDRQESRPMTQLFGSRAAEASH